MLAKLRTVDNFNCNFLLGDTVNSKFHEPCWNETKTVKRAVIKKNESTKFREREIIVRTGLPSTQSSFENVGSHRPYFKSCHGKSKFSTLVAQNWFIETQILPKSAELQHHFGSCAIFSTKTGKLQLWKASVWTSLYYICQSNPIVPSLTVIG